ncbi:selenium metabolism-associated LysR family transcriptional regulator [Tepidimicrobium xylanilyticum]|uniref:DNA-binding transcriptional regulator, LysR family n=1 Tax=Tepidimicrobium xylanilyticum TaxID=1123352 RepID=A0A1H3A9X3_9FIRM|nr:selenium metabolism-associated LysR family transcriptional regulator [Tepidimicrobium xylanilyticum]GMG96273.1 LysR family transcriptional regulator [Tepidimicrobium xylanilyticum]SDX26433.1 DNA-binding transcriptional regulator, LysR family [Tepidimicrobium xylanilyticum]
MDFRQLETFIQVANLKSFSRAAEKLYITQPTVSNHIQSLEKELGSILINRSGKSITLTEAGSLLYKYAINIINSCEMAKFDLAAYKGRIQGHLCIYSSSIPSKYILPKIIYEFSTKYPEVTFSLVDMDSADVVQSILDGDTDFGIVGAKYEENKLNNIELVEDSLLVITPNNPRFSKPNYSHLALDEVIKERILLREEGSGTRNLVEATLKKHNIDLESLNVTAYVEDTEVIKQLVSLGAGISFLSSKAVFDDIKLGKYKAYYVEGIEFSRKFYFVYHNKRQLSPLNETFRDFVISYIKDNSI